MIACFGRYLSAGGSNVAVLLACFLCLRQGVLKRFSVPSLAAPFPEKSAAAPQLCTARRGLKLCAACRLKTCTSRRRLQGVTESFRVARRQVRRL